MFLLAGTQFAFASTNDEQVHSKDAATKTVVVSEKAKTEAQKQKKAMSCFDFNDSCGGSWVVCHQGVSTWDLVNFLWAWDGGCGAAV